MFKADQLFNIPKFFDDIQDYMGRHKMFMIELANACDISPHTVRSAFNTNSLSLAMACRLADLADLSLDNYRINTDISGPYEAVIPKGKKEPHKNLNARVRSLELWRERIEENGI